MYSAVVPCGTVGGSVNKTAKAPEPVAELEDVDVCAEVERVLVCETSTPVNAAVPMSAIATIAAITPDSMMLFLELIEEVTRKDDIRNSVFEQPVQLSPLPVQGIERMLFALNFCYIRSS